MRAWVIGIGFVLLTSQVWADGASDDRSGMEGGRRIVAGSEASAVEGKVSIRPVRPVERKGVPNQRPYQARITVLDPTGREVAAVDSDADGKFRIALPPGTYVLRPESSGLYPRASEQRVEVGPNSVSRVEIVYDSGIR
ncbi:MAG: carboxypeptidase regulatory-like domain-containing protein [Candidatus Rokubacteria bacterium]|nr:carboxypeptidase regulatory-like domain-containing protein [Candidatus Rokubacteria bacterium]